MLIAKIPNCSFLSILLLFAPFEIVFSSFVLSTDQVRKNYMQYEKLNILFKCDKNLSPKESCC